MKRTLSLMLAGALSLGILAGCGGSKPKDVYNKQTTPAPAAETKPVTLKLGQIPVVDGLPFWVAEKNGYYKQQGVDVQLVTFKSAGERDAAITAGEIDGMLADPIATSTLIDSGTKVQIASVGLGVTKEEGPMGILAAKGSNITKLEDLKGVEIAISTNSVMHYVTEKVLLDNGFKPEEIKVTNIPSIPVRFETLMSGKVKAAILPDPLFSLAEKQGAKLLFNDKNAKQNYSLSVIVFTEKALKEKADGIRQFFVAYDRAVADIQIKPNAFKDLLVEKAKLPEEIKEAYQVIPFSVAQAPKKDELESVVNWLVDKKIIKSKLTYEQLVNTSVLPK